MRLWYFPEDPEEDPEEEEEKRDRMAWSIVVLEGAEAGKSGVEVSRVDVRGPFVGWW